MRPSPDYSPTILVFAYQIWTRWLEGIHLIEASNGRGKGKSRRPVSGGLSAIAELIFCAAQTVTEIAATERSIVDLKKAIKSKENDVKVCQTRLFLREKRPNIEQCRDPVHYQSVAIISVFRLHRMHEMQTFVTDVRGVCPLVCLSECTEWPHTVKPTWDSASLCGVIRCSLCQITLAPDRLENASGKWAIICLEVKSSRASWSTGRHWSF